MSGLYIHIPFCHHKCTYCDFHFSVNTRTLKKVIDGIVKEIRDRKDYLNTHKLETIYFGGGTPSILSGKDWTKIFIELSSVYDWDKNAEITVECNPEDINMEYLCMLKDMGVNRISLGVQSLDDEVLKWMGRIHTAEQSMQSIKYIQQSEIENFSVDIIFGIPGYPKEKLKKDLTILFDTFQPKHISAYQLTIEPRTKLNYLVKTKQLKMSDDEKVSEEFLMIQEMLLKRSFLHYEVSNYALPGYMSRHNSSYWMQKKYCGIGPSAHSYNGEERRWNVANNYLYAKKVMNNEVYYESEYLSEKQKFNEYMYTRLRTIYGCNIDEIFQMFGDAYKQHFLKIYQKNAEYFDVDENSKIFKLNPQKGYLLADRIALNFIYV
ncbi:MAG: radical SAM family heme chaperone HemW [Bacteroidia bacterium]